MNMMQICDQLTGAGKKIKGRNRKLPDIKHGEI
jgi:hypothetical protein